ncbi:MAG: hypothetical protein RIT25_44 [Planctomycetota bacterium]
MVLLRRVGAISGFTLVSRILGLIRDTLMAWAFGASWVSGTFLLVWVFPNLMRRLLGEGALSASFVPAYTAAHRKGGPDASRQLMAQVIGTMLTWLVPLTLAVVAASLLVPASWLAQSLETGMPGARLMLQLNAVLFPYVVPICLTAIYSGALNVLGSYGLPAAVPTVLNLFWIAALLLLGQVDPPWTLLLPELAATSLVLLPAGIGTTAALAVPQLAHEVLTPVRDAAAADGAVFLGWFLLAGGFAQVLVVLWPLRLAGALARPIGGFPPVGTPGRAVFVAMLPAILGMSASQLSTLSDQVLAYWFVSPGANTYLYLANRLLLFPHALTALSVAVAVFPKLAESASDTDRKGIRATLDTATGATLLITLPAAVGLMVIGQDLVEVLFQRQRFTAEDADATAITSICMVAGLPFIGLVQLYARAFYAVGDNGVPARFAVRLLLVNFSLNLVLVPVLGFGTEAIAASSSLTSALNALLLMRGVQRHCGAGHGIVGSWLRSLVACGAMVGAILLVRPDTGDDRMQMLLWRIALPIAVGAAAYFAAHLALRSPELAAVRNRFARRG